MRCSVPCIGSSRHYKKEELDQFADGTAVRQVGKKTFALAERVIDEVITVSIDEICAAVKDIFEDTRVIAEPAGALAVAGLKNHAKQGETVIALVSGANVNFDRLRHISERTEVGEKREILLGVSIPEKPGSFRRFCSLIGKRSVTEFNYRYADHSRAQVLVGIQTEPGEDRSRLISKVARRYKVTDCPRMKLPCCMFDIWWVVSLTFLMKSCTDLNFLKNPARCLSS